MREINTRLIALDILQKLDERRSNSTLLLQRELPRIADVKDRNLVTELVLGTLRWQKKLTGVIQRLSRRPLSQLDAKVLLILQLGIYQLAFTRIPEHAAIYETVNLCKRVRLTSAASFVNGVLRAAQERLPELPEPQDLNRAELLSYRWSHPQWLVDRWMARFGEEETISLMQTNNEPAPVYLRVNELRAGPAQVRTHLEEAGVQVEISRFGSSVMIVSEGAPQLSKSFSDGEFYIQDAGIEKLGEWIDPQPGMRVLEVAAAPGGKTLQLAIRTQGKGLIVSVDADLSRMKQWQRNIARLGITNAVPLVADARALAFTGGFDAIVVDAPCSSLGVIRRHPEIKWWRVPEDLPPLQALQLQIMESCCRYLDAGGELVYVVCSFEPEETLEVTEKFLQAHSEFELTGKKFLYPHRDQTDGFFLTKFKKSH